ncbi:hypothetical protein J6590_071972 [Homalodisca vitripennis]|nr:hypothetical protein J6590_071972 [Homalodisca vitripennis]
MFVVHALKQQHFQTNNNNEGKQRCYNTVSFLGAGYRLTRRDKTCLVDLCDKEMSHPSGHPNEIKLVNKNRPSVHLLQSSTSSPLQSTAYTTADNRRFAEFRTDLYVGTGQIDQSLTQLRYTEPTVTDHDFTTNYRKKGKGQHCNPTSNETPNYYSKLCPSESLISVFNTDISKVSKKLCSSESLISVFNTDISKVSKGRISGISAYPSVPAALTQVPDIQRVDTRHSREALIADPCSWKLSVGACRCCPQPLPLQAGSYVNTVYNHQLCASSAEIRLVDPVLKRADLALLQQNIIAVAARIRTSQQNIG